MTPEPLIEREPVRLPVWAATIVAGLIGLAIDLLMGGEWRMALAGFLTTVPPVLVGVEVARGRSWSPSSVWLATVQARRDAAPAPAPQGEPFGFPPPSS